MFLVIVPCWKGGTIRMKILELLVLASDLIIAFKEFKELLSFIPLDSDFKLPLIIIFGYSDPSKSQKKTAI